MKIQSVVFSSGVCKCDEFYYRASGKVNITRDSFWMECGSFLTTDTYMNAFDSYIWTKYTGYSRYCCTIRLTGKGIVRLCTRSQENVEVLHEIPFESKNNNLQVLRIEFVTQKENEIIYFEIEAHSEIQIYEAYYKIIDTECKHSSDINLSVVICTYQRKSEILRNIARLKRSKFFQLGSELYGHMDVHVVDNASELKWIDEPYLHLYHNPNTGGSGGFTRGIHEVRNRMSIYEATNVIFMDDDVDFMNETFYRLYALLTYMNHDYQNEVIAGRMFRMDQRTVQYTAVEIWNGGDIKHIGENLNMVEINNLYNMNQRGGEYTGWWFGCFPMSFIMKNDPMPFFLHCDDVEYGLRHGGIPIVLNGIQVWHETYEYRQSPIIAYYDMRNPLFVNEKYGIGQSKKEILTDWKEKITKAHIQKDWLLEYMLIRALLDYAKGIEWLQTVSSNEVHTSLSKKKYLLRIRNIFLWRMAVFNMNKGRKGEK